MKNKIIVVLSALGMVSMLFGASTNNINTNIVNTNGIKFDRIPTVRGHRLTNSVPLPPMPTNTIIKRVKIKPAASGKQSSPNSISTKPAALVVSPSPSNEIVKLTWNTNSIYSNYNVVSYSIYTSTNLATPSSNYTLLATVSNTLTFSITNSLKSLTNNASHFYSVNANLTPSANLTMVEYSWSTNTDHVTQGYYLITSYNGVSKTNIISSNNVSKAIFYGLTNNGLPLSTALAAYYTSSNSIVGGPSLIQSIPFSVTNIYTPTNFLTKENLPVSISFSYK